MRVVAPIFFRRMRTPLAVVISAYAIATLGFTLVPGVDDQGEPWRMNFLEAFYVVSYTGSTIGFGEVPYPFSNAQRLWTLVSIYLTVLAWLFAVGSIISLLQDPMFRQTLHRSQLLRSVRVIREPFYLIVGYGDTGRLLLRAALERGARAVVIDRDSERIDELRSHDFGVTVPSFCMDAEVPGNLLDAGLQHRWCFAVLAVTDREHSNLKVAITAKLYNQQTPVYASTETAENEANLLSFNTNYVVNPWNDFAWRLALALREPDTHRIQDWLSSLPNMPLPERRMPPEGRWIICGFGHLGRAIYKSLSSQGMDIRVIDEMPDDNGCPRGTVSGKGTQANTLLEAGLDEAAVLVAARNDDADNLSIMMTARAIRSDIYVICLENRLHNHTLIKQTKPDLQVQTSYITASRMMAAVGANMQMDFLARAAEQGNDWNAELADRIRHMTGGMTPETWTLRVSTKRAPAIALALEMGEEITVEDICRDPRQREVSLDVMPLMLARGDDAVMLPDLTTRLETGDKVLFAGTRQAYRRMLWNQQYLNALRYVHSGRQHPDGLLWRWLAKRRQAAGVDSRR